jgi:predicted DNA binding CopG/RHH family protein
MKEIPKFKNEDDERKFWATADSTKYVDWSNGKRKKLVKLKPSLRTISLRLPVAMIEDLKLLANRRDVPYQSLLKVFLAERLAKERPRRGSQLRFAKNKPSSEKRLSERFTSKR